MHNGGHSHSPIIRRGKPSPGLGIKDPGRGQRKLVGLKTEAKKRTRNGFKVAELRD